MNGMTRHGGYWADDQNWNEGYRAYDDLCYLDEYGYFQRKGQGQGKRKKGKNDDGKEENQEMASVSPTMFNLTPHRLLPYRTNSNNKLTTLLQHQALVMVSLQLQRQNQHVWMFWQPPYAEQEVPMTHSSRRTKPTWWSGTAEQEGSQEISCLSWRPWRTSLRSTTSTSSSAQRSWFAARWGFMEARLAKGTSLFSYGHSEETEIAISSWMLWRDRGIRWAADRVLFHFISYSLIWHVRMG